MREPVRNLELASAALARENAILEREAVAQRKIVERIEATLAQVAGKST